MRKDFGEKAERKWRFNAFDIILALLLVAALVALAIMIVHFFPEQSSTTGDTKITYIITVTDVPEAVSSQLKTGQTVFDIKTGKALGEVAAVASVPYVIKGVNEETGELVANTVPGRCDINVTVTAFAKSTPAGYSVNGALIACGTYYEFRTPTASLGGSCVSLKTQ